MQLCFRGGLWWPVVACGGMWWHVVASWRGHEHTREALTCGELSSQAEKRSRRAAMPQCRQPADWARK